MLELKITCESHEEARVYLNAHQYHNLISDLHAALRTARKHGTPTDVLQVFDNFMPDLCKAIDNSAGAY
jgi:hypothetical protein